MLLFASFLTKLPFGREMLGACFLAKRNSNNPLFRAKNYKQNVEEVAKSYDYYKIFLRLYQQSVIDWKARTKSMEQAQLKNLQTKDKSNKHNNNNNKHNNNNFVSNKVLNCKPVLQTPYFDNQNQSVCKLVNSDRLCPGTFGFIWLFFLAKWCAPLIFKTFENISNISRNCSN